MFSPTELIVNPKITRRELFKTAKKLSIGLILGSAGGSFLFNEIQKGMKGIRTDLGTFVPLYERHDVGIRTSDIPSNTQIYFREFDQPDLMTTPAINILSGTADVYANSRLQTSIRVFSDDVLNSLAEKGIEIMVGDVVLSDLYARQALDIFPWVYAGSFGLSSILLLTTFIPTLSRRSFLKIAGWISYLWGMSGITKSAVTFINPGSKQDSFKRIWSRSKGITVDLHPEDPISFFRSAIMALKLMTVASEMNKPLISFHTEGGHSNIEDFIQLGPDVTRSIILAHNRYFLAEIVNLNGGIEEFCSSRLFKLPKDFKTTNGEISFDVLKRISERTVIDRKLQEGLQKYNLQFNP